MQRPQHSTPAAAPLLQHPQQPQPHTQQTMQQQQPPLQQGGLLPHPQPHPQFAQGPPPGMMQQHPPQGFPQQGHPQQQFQQHPPPFQQGPPPQGFHPHQQQPPMMHPQQQHPHAPPQPQLQHSSSQQSSASSSGGAEADPFLSHVVSASLVDLLGKSVLILLRDGRKLIGDLLSFDQYSNIVVSNTAERKVIGGKYFDEPLGLYVIRGENVVLIGDQHPTRAARASPPIDFKAVSKAEFAALEAEEHKRLAALGPKAVAKKFGGEEEDLQ